MPNDGLTGRGRDSGALEEQQRIIRGPLSRLRVQPELAGLLKSQNPPSHSLGKVDKSELALVKKVVLPAFVDDTDEIVLCCSRVGQDSIDFT